MIAHTLDEISSGLARMCSSAVKNLRRKSKPNSNWSILNIIKDETAAQLINSPAVLVFWARGGGGGGVKNNPSIKIIFNLSSGNNRFREGFWSPRTRVNSYLSSFIFNGSSLKHLAKCINRGKCKMVTFF